MKTIVVLRHAHRNSTFQQEDNDLSERGQEQVSDLVEDYLEGLMPSGNQFLSSPKKRCIQTLQPLAEVAKKDLEVFRPLDEQTSAEGKSDFLQRIESLANNLKQRPGVTYICTHGDVIPELLNHLCGFHIDISKGDYLIIENDGESWVPR